jgi:hypothetical protein
VLRKKEREEGRKKGRKEGREKRNSKHYIIVKTLSAQNKEIIVKAAREKCQVTYKHSPSEKQQIPQHKF